MATDFLDFVRLQCKPFKLTDLKSLLKICRLISLIDWSLYYCALLIDILGQCLVNFLQLLRYKHFEE